MTKKIEDIKRRKNENEFRVPVKKEPEDLDFFKRLKEEKEKKERKEKESDREGFLRETKTKKDGNIKKIIIFSLIIISVATVCFWWLKNFSSVVIKIIPIQKRININSFLSAYQDPLKLNSGKPELSLETIQISKEDSISFVGSGLIKGGQRATGIVVLYNTYSNKNQYLLIDTRISTPDGKIYKTKKAVNIPANGSVEVEVYADKPGDEYNIGLSDFKIVGFKGTDKYDKIYGRSKTPITGGTLEDAQAASFEDINNAKNSLQEKIKNYLIEEINKQVPEGYILYKGALVLDFSEDMNNPVAGSIGKSFVYKLKGSATAFLLKKEELNKILALKYLNITDNNELNKIYIFNLEDLSFNLISREKENKIDFNLKGNAIFVWKIDEDLLAQELISSNNNIFPIFEKFPEIEKSEIIFRPSWWNYLPNEKSRIHFEQIIK